MCKIRKLIEVKLTWDFIPNIWDILVWGLSRISLPTPALPENQGGSGLCKVLVHRFAENFLSTFFPLVIANEVKQKGETEGVKK